MCARTIIAVWWSRRDSNPRPPPCQGGALPLRHCPTANEYNRGGATRQVRRPGQLQARAIYGTLGLMTLADLAGYRGQELVLFGGSFDPIHYGHLLVAEQARERYEPDLVLFVPNRASPLKPPGLGAAAEDRYRMVELAAADNPHFAACNLELERPGPSYSVDTVRAVRRLVPAGVQILFVVGADALLELDQWYEPEALLSEAQVVVARRPGFDLDGLCRALGPQRTSQIEIMSMRLVDISATDIRQRVARGQSIRYLTPPAVIDYIYRQGLYGASPSGDQG